MAQMFWLINMTDMEEITRPEESEGWSVIDSTGTGKNKK